MTFGVVGLGLIGGSIAKALYALEGAKVYAFDSDRTTLDRAFLQNAVSKELTEENIGECDYIFLALYPRDVISYIQKYGKYISKNAVALDCSGTKRKVCEKCFDIAEKYGIDPATAEQIARLYLTHPGVTADGIMTKMGL